MLSTPSIIHGRAVAPATPFVTHGHIESRRCIARQRRCARRLCVRVDRLSPGSSPWPASPPWPAWCASCLRRAAAATSMSSSRRSPRHASPSRKSRASSCISTAAAARTLVGQSVSPSAATRFAATNLSVFERLPSHTIHEATSTPRKAQWDGMKRWHFLQTAHAFTPVTYSHPPLS